MLHYSAIPVAVREVMATLSPRLDQTDFALVGGTSLALRFGQPDNEPDPVSITHVTWQTVKNEVSAAVAELY